MSALGTDAPGTGGRTSDAPPAPVNRFPGLLRAEVRRFLARRFIRLLFALAALGWAGALAVSMTQYASPTPERLAVAQSQRAEALEQTREFREQCLAETTRPADLPAELACGEEVRESDYPVEGFLSPQPFSLAREAQSGALAFAAAGSVLLFLVGATFVGAEWSTRSMVALLFWETRRTRVLGAKLLVVVAAGLIGGVLAQAAWLAMSSLLDAVHGNGRPLPAGFWSEQLGVQGRSVLLTVVAALLGFGITNLVRNTGAALGAAFVYFAVLETAIRVLVPAWQPWLLTNAAAGLVLPGGLRLTIPEAGRDPNGLPMTGYREVVVGNLQAGLWLAVVTAVVVAIGMALFARRDVH